MPVFPQKKEEMIALSRKVIKGLKANPDIFRDPPFPVTEMEKTLADINTANIEIEANKAAVSRVEVKRKNYFSNLNIQLRRYINYAEDILGKKSDQLQWIGWGVRKPKSPLKPPGKISKFKCSKGYDWIRLFWKSPKNGGRAAIYKIEERECPETEWKEHSITFKTEISISNLPGGKALEYRVTAINKAGPGHPSSIISIGF